MRTRLKGYVDYGLTDTRVKEILEYCRTTARSELIMQAAEKANPELAIYLVESLKERMSYYKLYKKYFIPLSCSDFYGYRRLTISLLNDVLIEQKGKLI